MNKTYGIQPIDDGGVLDYYIDIEQINEFLKKNNLQGTYDMGGYSDKTYGEICLIQTLSTDIILPEWNGGLVSNNPQFYNESLDCWLYVFELNPNAQNIVKIYDDENEFHNEWLKGEIE